jgi:hypothetical protein
MKKEVIKIIVQIALLVLIVLLIFCLIGAYRQINRITDNVTTAIESNNSKVYNFTKSEFADFEKSLKDSLYFRLKDSLNIKIKHIERTITNEYTFTYDSTFTILVKPPNSIYREFTKEFDSCFKVTGRVNNDTIFWDVPVINYHSETIYYWQRKHKFLGIPFGKKVFKAKTLNNCDGESKVTEIIIEKE